MTSSKPIVSIGMPVFNEEKFISKAIDSLLQQDFEDFELIISDNASTDRTFEICIEYKNKDQRIKLHRNKRNLGAANFKRVVNLTSGKYFMLAGGHDLWHPSFINRCVEMLENDPSLVLCYTSAMKIDVDDNPVEIASDDIDTRSLTQIERFRKTLWGLYECSSIYSIMRLDILMKTSLIQNSLLCDVILLLELSLFGAFAQIGEPLFYLRINRPEETIKETVERHRKWLLSLKDDIINLVPYMAASYNFIKLVRDSEIDTSSKDLLIGEIINFVKLGVCWNGISKEEVRSLLNKIIEIINTNQNNISLLRASIQKAFYYFEFLLILFPNIEQLHIFKALCLANLEKLNEAKTLTVGNSSQFLNIKKFDILSKEVKIDCVISAIEHQLFVDTEKNCRMALTQKLPYRRNLSILFKLASFYAKQQRFSEAEEKFKETLSLDPPDRNTKAGILVALANIYSQQQRYKEAEEKLKEAISLKLYNKNIIISIHYTLGSNYEREGQLNQAKQEFGKVLKLIEEIQSSLDKNRFGGGVHFHLGCIYQSLKKRREAKHHLEECLRFIPEHRKAREILREVLNG